MTQYFVPIHVHFALEADTAIFMDLRADRYSMLVGSKARAFKSLIESSPHPDKRAISVAEVDDTEPHRSVLAELVENKLLTLDPRLAIDSPAQQLPLPEDNLLELTAPVPADIHARDALRFIASLVTAKWRLACAGIEKTVRTVERRKRLRDTGTPLDLREASRLLVIYSRLRRYLPIDSACLFDSISLLDFLARYGCFPSLVFAVRLDPWMAHCWVQHDTVSFNQDADHARSYLLVLSV